MVLDPNYFASKCQHRDQKEISQFFHDLKSRENKTEEFEMLDSTWSDQHFHAPDRRCMRGQLNQFN